MKNIFQPVLRQSIDAGEESYTHRIASSLWSFAPAPLRALLPRPLVIPSLPPPSSASNYTLVLDLDETLLHTEWFKGQPERFIVHERPFVREFLRSLKKLPYEVIIFTAGIQGYADTVIDIMDKDTKSIAHRLYRQHTTSWGFQRWKDLSLVNRDLECTLIIDNCPEVFRYHPDNGLEISAWEGHRSINGIENHQHFQNVDDFALINLLFWLEHIIQRRFSIPSFVRKFKNQCAFALGHSSPTIKGAPNYVPPFELGPVSIELLRRCLPDSPALLTIRMEPLYASSSDEESTDDNTLLSTDSTPLTYSRNSSMTRISSRESGIRTCNNSLMRSNESISIPITPMRRCAVGNQTSRDVLEGKLTMKIETGKTKTIESKETQQFINGTSFRMATRPLSSSEALLSLRQQASRRSKESLEHYAQASRSKSPVGPSHRSIPGLSCSYSQSFETRSQDFAVWR